MDGCGLFWRILERWSLRLPVSFGTYYRNYTSLLFLACLAVGSASAAQTQVGNAGMPESPAISSCLGIGASGASNTALQSDGSPRFIGSPGDVVAYLGFDFSLNALVVGAPPMTFQWRLDDVNISDATGPVYSIAEVVSADAGAYSVVVSNAFGAVTGLVANVFVEIKPQEVPVIGVQPVSQDVFKGTNVTFSVQASGYPQPTYQWQWNGANIAGATNDTYSIPVVLTNNAGDYRVIVKNALGTAMSDVATLTVHVPNWPVFLYPAQIRTVYKGGAISFSGMAEGAEPITYQWQFNGSNLTGATGPTLALGSVIHGDEGNYRVVASNEFGVTVGPDISLVLTPVMTWGDNKSIQTNLPADTTNAIAISAGYKHVLALKADGTVVGWGDNQYGQISTPGDLTNVVAVAAGNYHSLALRADGTVAAWGYNSEGQINIPANATNIIAIAGGEASSLALKADGTVVGWGRRTSGLLPVPVSATNVVAIGTGATHGMALRADGTVAKWGGGYVLPQNATNLITIAAFSNYGLGINADMRLVSCGGLTISSSSGNNVRAIAIGSNFYMAIGDSDTINISSASFIPSIGNNFKAPDYLTNIGAISAGNNFCVALSRPQLVPMPQVVRRFAYYGGPAVFSAVGAGEKLVSYQWQLNGNNIAGATGAHLVFPETSPDLAGDYQVVVSDSRGAVTGAVTHLELVMPPLPQILKQPISMVVAEGKSVTLYSTNEYAVPGKFQWYHDGISIPNASNYTLTLTNVQSSSAGEYQMVITNWSGAVTSQVATLTVTSTPPSFLVQPQSKIIMPGLPVIVSAVAAGSEPLYYQWQFNGESVTGATNATLTLPLASASDAGNYRLVVSNKVTSVSSQDVTLSVAPFTFWGDASAGQSQPPLALSNVLALAAGGSHLLGLRTDGRVFAWGNNSCGQTNVPVAATNVVMVAAGELHSLALRVDGTMVAWGNSSFGQANVPAGLSNVVQIAAGMGHSLALKADGTVSVWGQSIASSSNAPTGLSNVVAVAGGGLHSLALRRDGTVVSWGRSTYVPPQATNIVAIAAGYAFSVGLKSDGSLVAWGYLEEPVGMSFEFGCSGYSIRYALDNGEIKPLLPIPAEATNIVAVSAGRYHILALRADGRLISWGDNSQNQLKLPELSPVVGIAAGGYQSVAWEGPAEPILGMLQPDQWKGEGASVLLTGAVGGMPPYSYQWWRNNLPITEATNRFLFFSKIAPSDSGDYKWAAFNPAGSVTGSVSLVVTSRPPVIVQQPVDLFLELASNAVFSVAAMGTEPLTYQWSRNGVNLADGPKISGTQTGTLTIKDATTDSMGQYSVLVTNSVGRAVSSEASLSSYSSLIGDALNSSNLVWRMETANAWHRQSDTTHDGKSALLAGPFYAAGGSWLETTITGPVTVSFWWMFNGVFDHFGVLLDGVEMTTIPYGGTWQQSSVYVPEGLHTLRWVLSCTPSGGPSSGWLDQVTLGEAVPPALASKPTSSTVYSDGTVIYNVTVTGTASTPLTVQAGGSATVNVSPTGTVPMTCQWQFNGTNIDGATNTTLALNNLQLANAGDYRVIVSNIAGSVTSTNAGITVLPTAPIVRLAKKHVSVARGGTAAISVQTSGSDPIAVDWEFNRAKIPEVHSTSLVVTNVNAEDLGLYRVVAHNAQGTTYGTEILLEFTPVVAWGLNSDRQTEVPEILGEVAAAACGYRFSETLMKDGSVIKWGGNSYFGPQIPLDPNERFVALTARADHHIGLRADGTIVEWGSDPSGASAPAGLSGVVSIAAGFRHHLAIQEDGSIVGWGRSSEGQLNPPPQAVRLVAAGCDDFFSLGLREDGRLFCWGANTNGELNIPLEATNIVSVAAGWGFCVALRDDGRVFAWGQTNSGKSIIPEGLTNAVAITAGENSSLAVQSDGTVVGWGYNGFGECNIPAGLTNVVGIAAGDYHSIAIIGDGKPVITVQPFNRHLISGDRARLHVMAIGDGAGSLAYQWRRDGVDIPGALGPSLDLGKVQAGDAAGYQVVITNSLGSVTSKVAQVSVALPMLSLNAWRASTGGLGITLTGPSPARYQIEGSTNLDAWTPISDITNLTGTVEWFDTNSFNASQYFIRAVILPGQP